jgi:predicted dehydrogenase
MLLGVFDSEASKANHLAQEFACSSYSNIEELLLSGCDIVVVCTPSGLHEEHTIRALNAGKHVLVEKPMTLSFNSAQKMVHSAQKNGKHLFVVKQNRFNPPIHKLKEVIDTGKLGEVFQVSTHCFWNRNHEYYAASNWRGTKQYDGGILWNQFSHFVDILYYLFGDISDAHGFLKNCNHLGVSEIEDTGSFTFTFKNGAVGSLSISTNAFAQNMEGSITVLAENGTIKIGGKYLNAVEYIQSDNVDMKNLPLSAPANNYGYYEGSMSNHDKVIQNVINALRGNEPIMTSAHEGAAVVQMIEQLYNSAQWI